tara:strand:+ start:280 stop:642 length:363 start_codon:yes stop_codon:yes gene_type:complete
MKTWYIVFCLFQFTTALEYITINLPYSIVLEIHSDVNIDYNIMIGQEKIYMKDVHTDTLVFNYSLPQFVIREQIKATIRNEKIYIIMPKRVLEDDLDQSKSNDIKYKFIDIEEQISLAMT